MRLRLAFISIILLFTIENLASSYEKDTIKSNTGELIVITFIKHGSLMLEYKDLIFHVDPLMEYTDYSDFPKADFILLTHEHPDHLDSVAINVLSDNRTRLITNAACNKILGKGDIMSNGDSLFLNNDVYVKAVPAYNITQGREFWHPKERDNGFILHIGGSNIYIAGDTEDIPELEEFKDIDIAFLPVNQPFTMTPKQAIRAARMINPRILYPYHYNDTDVSIIKKALTNDPIEVRIRQMQ